MRNEARTAAGHQRRLTTPRCAARTFATSLTVAAALALFALRCFAADEAAFPVKPVHLIVPFPPGGSLDISGRLLARYLQERWKQPIVVENKAGSTVGPDYVAKSAPDGYTLLIISSTPLVTLPQMQKTPYDVLNDLVGITQTVLLTYSLVTSPKSGIESIQSLIDRAKMAPGTINYSSAGNGSGQHLYVELLKSAAGIDLVHVPYKGSAPALQAVLSNEVPLVLDVTLATGPGVKAGELKALMLTGNRTLPQFPGAVPFDSLFPGLGIASWHGIFARAGTPQPVLRQIESDVMAVLRLPEVQDRFRQLGIEPSGVSGQAFNEIVQHDYARWGEIIRRNGLRSD